MTRTACRPGSERLHIRSAVCGPDAVRGKCTHSVVQQLSTMPAWMYEGGTNYSDIPVSRGATIRWHLHPSVDTSEL